MASKEKIKTTLIELLEKYSADHLTVKMVCMEAKISKQTLYNNYYGILEAVEDVIGDFIEEAMKDFHRTSNWFDGIRSVLRMLSDRKAVVMHLYDSRYRQDVLAAISGSIRPVIENGIRECARDAKVEVDDHDQTIMADMYIDVFMGLISRYLDNRMTDDPDRLVYVYETMMTNRTIETLNSINELRNKILNLSA